VAARSKKPTTRGSFVELVMIVVVALGLALGIQAFLVKPFRIPSASMVPTLDIGQRVLVDRVSLRFGDPDVGDVIVFKPPLGADTDTCGAQHPDDQPCPRPTDEESKANFIKRVIATGGDRVKVIDGHAYVNGKRLNEPYARFDSNCGICNLPREMTVPKGYYFMMGDNRGESADSRLWGPIDKDAMIGKAFMTYWPPGRIGGI
jgi:signal peptidase I